MADHEECAPTHHRRRRTARSPTKARGSAVGAQRERAPAALRTAAAGASSACGACLPVRCEINNKAVTNSGQRGARGSESNDEC